jgi:hypothetical protein
MLFTGETANTVKENAEAVLDANKVVVIDTNAEKS